jgi:hypothetical protein
MDAIYSELPPLDRSRLFRALMAERNRPVSSDPTDTTLKPATGRFELGTSQIIRMIKRYSLNAITFDKLNAIPLSQLSTEEKDFVLFLRRNESIFRKISRLDNEPDTLSVQDIKLAAQLAGDALTLSTEDLKYLKETSMRMQSGSPASLSELSGADGDKSVVRSADDHPTARELEALLQKLAKAQTGGVAGNSAALSYAALMALQPEQARLTPQERKGLDFLKSPAVSGMLAHLAEDGNGLITPDVIRILATLLWNPLVYGTTPIVFYKTSVGRSPAHVEAVEPAHAVDAVTDEDLNPHTPKAQAPHLRLTAHDITAICHRISPDGTVTLAQLRAYAPVTPEEAKALNLLRQNRIFDRLANLDHHSETLSDEDIRLAVSKEALILSDPAIVLVILP